MCKFICFFFATVSFTIGAAARTDKKIIAAVKTMITGIFFIYSTCSNPILFVQI